MKKQKKKKPLKIQFRFLILRSSPVAQLPTFHSHLLRRTGSEKNLSQIPARFRGLKAHRRTILFRRKQTTKRRIDTRSNTAGRIKVFFFLSDRAKRARFPMRGKCLLRVVEVLFFPYFYLIARKEIKQTGSSLVYNYFRSY